MFVTSPEYARSMQLSSKFMISRSQQTYPDLKIIRDIMRDSILSVIPQDNARLSLNSPIADCVLRAQRSDYILRPGEYSLRYAIGLRFPAVQSTVGGDGLLRSSGMKKKNKRKLNCIRYSCIYMY